MTFGSPSVGLGEYIVLWAIAAIVAVAFLGWLLGTALGGAILFGAALILGVIILYAIATRLRNFALHGSISAGGDD